MSEVNWKERALAAEARLSELRAYRQIAEAEHSGLRDDARVWLVQSEMHSQEADYWQKESQRLERKIAKLKKKLRESFPPVGHWQHLNANVEEAVASLRTDAPLLTHEQVFGLSHMSSQTVGLPDEGKQP